MCISDLTFALSWPWHLPSDFNHHSHRYRHSQCARAISCSTVPTPFHGWNSHPASLSWHQLSCIRVHLCLFILLLGLLWAISIPSFKQCCTVKRAALFLAWFLLTIRIVRDLVYFWMDTYSDSGANIYINVLSLQLHSTLIKDVNSQSLFVLPGPCPTLHL